MPSATHSYMGYNIPVDLMWLTGLGPENFDAISQSHFALLNKWIAIQPDHTVLELGCGIGRDAIPLSKHLKNGRYVGVDILKRSIDWCSANISSRHPNFAFLYFDVKNQLYNPTGSIQTTDIRIPLKDNSVDRIFLFSVFTHMMRPEIEHFLREFRRMLKSDGLIYATTFVYNDEIFWQPHEKAILHLGIFNLNSKCLMVAGSMIKMSHCTPLPTPRMSGATWSRNADCVRCANRSQDRGQDFILTPKMAKTSCFSGCHSIGFSRSPPGI